MKWLFFYPGRKGAFLSWGILKCPAGQEWAWGYHSCSRAGMLPEAGPASRESGMGAALSRRERSSKLPLPGSAAPLWSSHPWDNIPPHFSYPPPLCKCWYLGTVWVFPLSKLELLLCQERGQQAAFNISGKCSHYSSNISLCKRGFSASLVENSMDFLLFFFSPVKIFLLNTGVPWI